MRALDVRRTAKAVPSRKHKKIEEVKKDINHTALNQRGKIEEYEVLILYFDHQLIQERAKKNGE